MWRLCWAMAPLFGFSGVLPESGVPRSVQFRRSRAEHATAGTGATDWNDGDSDCSTATASTMRSIQSNVSTSMVAAATMAHCPQGAHYACDAIGRRVPSSKLRHVWTLPPGTGATSDTLCVCIELIHSRWSGQKRVCINGREVLKTRRRHLNWTYQHRPAKLLISLASEGSGFRLACEPTLHEGASSPAPSPRLLSPRTELKDVVAALEAQLDEDADAAAAWEEEVLKQREDWGRLATLVSPTAAGSSQDAAQASRHDQQSPAVGVKRSGARHFVLSPRDKDESTNHVQRLNDLAAEAAVHAGLSDYDDEAWNAICDAHAKSNASRGAETFSISTPPQTTRKIPVVPRLVLPGSIDEATQIEAKRVRLLSELADRDAHLDALRKELNVVSSSSSVEELPTTAAIASQRRHPECSTPTAKTLMSSSSTETLPPADWTLAPAFARASNGVQHMAHGQTYDAMRVSQKKQAMRTQGPLAPNGQATPRRQPVEVPVEVLGRFPGCAKTTPRALVSMTPMGTPRGHVSEPVLPGQSAGPAVALAKTPRVSTPLPNHRPLNVRTGSVPAGRAPREHDGRWQRSISVAPRSLAAPTQSLHPAANIPMSARGPGGQPVKSPLRSGSVPMTARGFVGDRRPASVAPSTFFPELNFRWPRSVSVAPQQVQPQRDVSACFGQQGSKPSTPLAYGSKPSTPLAYGSKPSTPLAYGGFSARGSRVGVGACRTGSMPPSTVVPELKFQWPRSSSVAPISARSGKSGSYVPSALPCTRVQQPAVPVGFWTPGGGVCSSSSFAHMKPRQHAA